MRQLCRNGRRFGSIRARCNPAGDTVFFGTSPVGGAALAEVTATGVRTQFGGIVVRLEEQPL
jgi:hypothetical protein